MEKKESLELETPSRITTFSKRTFSIIKFILGICILPFVYSTSVSFLDELALIEKSIQTYFWWGVISFLTIYLFIWEPHFVYIKGQKLLQIIFCFFAPLVKIAPYVLPIYTIIIFLVYIFFSFMFRTKELINYFIFLFGFSLTLHLIFSVKSLRSKQQDFLKANYIFGFSLIYVINLILIAFCLNLVFKEFSFVNFFNKSFQIGKNIFYIIFKQLFL